MSSFGEELRRERELRQITLREIAEATKISLRYLDALERNDFRNLPGGVFNKGFVRAYAQYIGVDPEAMVNAYLLEARGQQPVPGEGSSPEVFRAPSGTPTRSIVPDPTPGRKVWPAVLAGALVLVMAASAVVWWWWTTARRSRAGASAPLQHAPVATDSPDGEPGTSGDRGPDPIQGGAEIRAGSGTAAAPLVPEVAGETDPQPAIGPGAGDSPEIRIVLHRPTQGKLNCDNRRVEILDGMTAGTELIFTCRDSLLVDALDGGALLVKRGRAEAASLGPDGVPVVSHDLVRPRASASAEEPS